MYCSSIAMSAGRFSSHSAVVLTRSPRGVMNGSGKVLLFRSAKVLGAGQGSDGSAQDGGHWSADEGLVVEAETSSAANTDALSTAAERCHG